MSTTRLIGWAAAMTVVFGLAAAGCTVVPEGAEVCKAELRGFERVSAEQRRGDWCWAACAEMVLRYNDVRDVTQESLVAHFKDDPKNQTANMNEIVRALAYEPERGQGPDGWEKWLRGGRGESKPGEYLEGWIKAAGRKFAVNDAVRDLQSGQPVVVGLRNYRNIPGHVVVVTAIEYREKRGPRTGVDIIDNGVIDPASDQLRQFDSGSDFEVERVEIFDPMPGSGGTAYLSRDELKTHLDFWLSRRQAKEIASKWEQIVEFR